MLLDVNAIGVYLSIYTPRNETEHIQLNNMVYVQYNLRLRRNQLLNKTPASGNITLDDFDPSSEWVVETQAPVFDNEDLFGWIWTHLQRFHLQGQGNQVGLRIPLLKRMKRKRMRMMMMRSSRLLDARL